MARRGRRVLTALLLGLVTSVVVAWGIAVFVKTSGATMRGGLVVTRHALLSSSEWGGLGQAGRWLRSKETLEAGASLEKREFMQKEWQASLQIEGGPPSASSWNQWGGLHRDEPFSVVRRQRATGFPMLCLWYEYSGGMSMFGGPARLSGGIDLDKMLRRSAAELDPPALPLRPAWTGLIVNTLAYGLTWFGVFTLVGRWRKRRADRHGKCRECGYDLRGLAEGAVCPECGREAAEKLS